MREGEGTEDGASEVRQEKAGPYPGEKTQTDTAQAHDGGCILPAGGAGSQHDTLCFQKSKR